MLLGAGFDIGFVVDGMEEAGFKQETGTQGGMWWRDMPEIPPILVVRMRLLKPEEAEHG